VLCDLAFVEYSFDGLQWARLGAAGQGTNWYDSTFNAWNTNSFTRWHVASIPLPQPPAGATLHLRFVLSADPAVDFEGLAVDDVHIYDLAHGIFPASGITMVSRDLSGSVWTDYLQADQVLAALQPRGQSLSNVSTVLYVHDTLSNPSATQYTFPRSYAIRAVQPATDSTGIRLYLMDTDVVRVLADTSCPSCTPIKDAYTLGITGYTNTNNATAENGTLTDDTGGVFTYYPYRSIQWVPYDKGYYAQLNVKPLSEFWFNDGGPTASFPAGVDYLSFTAFKTGDNVTAYWYSLIDTAVSAYTLERSADGLSFDTVHMVTATHTDPAEYTYADPAGLASGDTLYYRLKWQMTGRSAVYYSPVRKITGGDSAAGLVSLRAAMAGTDRVLVSWTSYIDGIADHYRLERAVNNGAFSVINTSASLRHYGQQYDYIDMPVGSLHQADQVHYRLTIVLADGSSIVLPVRTVYWINGSAVINIYPNPTSDGAFTITWNADPGVVMQVQLTDALGRVMDQASFTATQWNNSAVLQTARRPKGVYFVRMVIGDTRYTARLLYE